MTEAAAILVHTAAFMCAVAIVGLPFTVRLLESLRWVRHDR